MPIYEYKCNKCDAVFDYIILKADEENSIKCDKCGCTDVQKLVSRVRYLAGPKADGLASNVEKKMLKSFGGKMSEKTRKEIIELSKTAGERGKRRFESMMDTGKSESIEY